MHDQESCVINRGITAKFFKLEKGAPQAALQGDPVSAYLFIFCLEIVFMLIKNSKSIQGIKMFENTFLYPDYAHGSIFLLEDKKLNQGTNEYN